MPSTKPLIPLRLDQALYDRVIAAARAETRSPANYILHQLRLALGSRGAKPSHPVTESAPAPFGNSGLFGHAAPSLTPPREPTLAESPERSMTPIPAQPHEWEIPQGWRNRYGLTVEEQDRYDEDKGLDYWPADCAPAPEPFPACPRTNAVRARS